MIYFLDNSLQLQKIVTSKNVISAIHEHELNGLIRADVELDLSYANKFLVLGIDHVGYYYKDEFYLHKIQRVEYDHVNETATVVLRHIFFEDMIFGKLIRDVRPQNQDALTVSRQTIDANTRWQTIMTDVTGRLSTNFYWQVPYEVIEFMTENYRIEYLPKILFDGQKINGFQLHLANKIGEDKNIRIPYGSRVLDLKYEEDYSEIITKLVVHGKGEEVGDGYGRRINISDVNFSRNGVESPIGSLYLEDESITNTYGNDGQTPREGREVFEDIEDANELAEAGYQHYLQVSRPQMLFTADVADIGDVGIGDSVMIIRREYDVYFNARIHKLSVDLLYPEDAQVELGDYKHFKESKIARKSREKNNRVQGQLSDRITRLKLEADERFDNEVDQWKSEYEQALIDVHSEIETDRENMTNLIEGTRTEFTDNLNAEISQTKEYAEQQAQEKAETVRTDLETVTSGHQALIDGLKDNVLDIDTFLGDKSETLKQQFDTVRTDFGTLQTDLDGVESDLTATKTDLQNQLDEARAELEGLEVGGRNLFLNSDFSDGLTNWVRDGVEAEVKNGALKFYNPDPSFIRQRFYYNSIRLPLGEKYIISFDAKAEEDGVIFRMSQGGTIYTMFGEVELTTEMKRYSIVLESMNEYTLSFHPITPQKIITLEKIQLEKGTVATDWTLAPEDTEQKITTLNQQIEFIDGQLSAKLEQTDIEPINNKITEYGNSLTANAQSIESLISKSELHDGDITKWSNLTTETAEGLEQTIGRVSTAEGKLSNAESAIEANADGLALRATRTEVEQAIDGIEVGGRNLFSVSNYLKSLTTASASVYGITDDYKIEIKGVDSSIASRYGVFAHLEPNQKYIMTFNYPMNDRFEFRDSDDVDIQLMKNWDESNKVLTFTTNQKEVVFKGKLYPVGPDYPYKYEIKLEKGNVATDWTPAPEDIQSDITQLNTDVNIEAGKIETLISKTDGHDTQLTNIVADYNSIEQTVAANDDWLGTHGSNVLQTVDGFEQKVWMSDIQDIGANLIPFSDTQNQAIMVENWEFLSDGGSTFYTSVTSSNFFTLRNTHSGTNLRMKSRLFDRLVAGKEYTLSFLIQRTSGVNSNYNYTWITRPSEVGSFRLGDPTRITDNGDGTYTHEYVFTSDYTGKVGVTIGSYTSSGQDLWLRVKEPKLERGTKRTPYMTAFSVVEQRAEELSLRVQELSSINGEELISQSDISVLPDRVLIGSQNIGAIDMASILSVSPTAIDMITDELNLTGNLNVKGQIEAISLDAIDANFARVQTAILKSNVITSDHIQVGTALVDKMFATSARIDELITKTHFVNEMHALTLNVVDLNASEIRARLLTANTIEAEWLKGGTALIDRLFATTAMFERMMAKSGFVTTLNTVTIDTDQLTIRRPDGVAWVSQGLARGHVPVQIFDNYADSSVQFSGLNFVTSSSLWKNFKYFYTPHEGSRLRVVWAVSLQTGNSASEYIEVGVNGFGNYNPVNNGTGSSTRRQLVYAGQTEYITQDIPLPPPNFQTFQANLQFRRSPTGVHLDNRVTARILHIGQYN